MMREVLKRAGAEEDPPGPDDVTLSPEAKERIKKALNHA